MKVHVSKDSISLETDLDLDYWEVDPDWDGKFFKSAAQAKRPVRSGKIPYELKIKAGRNVLRPTCDRAGRTISVTRLSDIQRRGWF